MIFIHQKAANTTQREKKKNMNIYEQDKKIK